MMVEITTAEHEQYYLIEVEGDVDASSSIFLDEALTKAEDESPNVLVDCKKLEYISSAGLGVFMSRIDGMEESGRKLVLFGLSEKVVNVFQILGLDQLLTIVESFEEAKEKVNAL